MRAHLTMLMVTLATFACGTMVDQLGNIDRGASTDPEKPPQQQTERRELVDLSKIGLWGKVDNGEPSHSTRNECNGSNCSTTGIPNPAYRYVNAFFNVDVVNHYIIEVPYPHWPYDDPAPPEIIDPISIELDEPAITELESITTAMAICTTTRLPPPAMCDAIYYLPHLLVTDAEGTVELSRDRCPVIVELCDEKEAELNRFLIGQVEDHLRERLESN